MQRYNSFAMIHKALRTLLYDVALTLQQTYFADDSEAEIALEKIETALYVFEQHAHHEDNHILPAIELHEPQLVADFENQHVADIALGSRLKTLLNMFRYAVAKEDQIYCGSAISKAFVEFMVFNLEHMAEEELYINQALWKHYTDEQLIILHQKLSAGIPPAEKALTAKWMMRGVNNVEAVSWLKGIKQAAPAVVFEAMINITETELPEQRRDDVLNAVLESEMSTL